jgi:hypothetical protein
MKIRIPDLGKHPGSTTQQKRSSEEGKDKEVRSRDKKMKYLVFS